jgi:hypothetical protein
MESPFDYRWTERGKGAPALPSPAAGLPGSRWPDPLLLATIVDDSFDALKFPHRPVAASIHGQAARPQSWGGTMKNPLDSLWGTIICGLVLTAILYYVVKSIPL